MSKLRIASPQQSTEPESETLRRRLEDGSLNLRGVAAILRTLEQDLEDDQIGSIVTVRLLSRIVDQEADAMGEAEAFLNGKAVA